MPNEPVQCPNCGSGDVQNLAVDSYTCEHCHSKFHFVSPTTSTIVQESWVCKCGNNAEAYCVRCREPLCENHKKGGFDFDFDMEFLIPSGTPPEIVRAVKGKHRIPEVPKAVLCGKCESECLEAVEKAFPDTGNL